MYRMNRCENNVDGKKMGEIDKEDDSLAIELYRNTMTGQWNKVVEMYKEHQIKAISAKINTSGDTALHVAVSIASDKEAQQLVRVIKDWYDKEVKKIEDRYDPEVKKIIDKNGFPIKIKIPVNFFVDITVTFLKFKYIYIV